MAVKDFAETMSQPIEKYGVNWSLSANTCIDEEDNEEYLAFKLSAKHTYESE